MTTVGVTVFSTVSAAVGAVVTDAVEEFDATAAPAGVVADAVAVFVIGPPSTSAWVTV